MVTGSSSGRGKRAASAQCTLKYLVPEEVAAAVIGKDGAVIAAMRKRCSAKIALTEHGEVYPQTDCRVLTAQAKSEEALNEVSRRIVAKVGELVETGVASQAVGTQGLLKIGMLVPRAAVGGVIGKGGASIKRLREASGAAVSISEPVGSGPGAEQVVSMAGSPEALELVLVEVNRQVQILSGEAWFATWASATSVVGAVQAGASAGATLPTALVLAAAAGVSYPGAASVRPAAITAGVDIMIGIANRMPPHVLDDTRGFALGCVVPHFLVGGLIGRGGSGTKEVEQLTRTKIGIREIEGDPDNRTLNITGPLANTCAAYMLMMKRYIDSEAEAEKASAGRR